MSEVTGGELMTSVLELDDLKDTFVHDRKMLDDSSDLTAIFSAEDMPWNASCVGLFRGMM